MRINVKTTSDSELFSLLVSLLVTRSPSNDRILFRVVQEINHRKLVCNAEERAKITWCRIHLKPGWSDMKKGIHTNETWWQFSGCCIHYRPNMSMSEYKRSCDIDKSDDALDTPCSQKECPRLKEKV